jgi:PKD repeat protein
MKKINKIKKAGKSKKMSVVLALIMISNILTAFNVLAAPPTTHVIVGEAKYSNGQIAEGAVVDLYNQNTDEWIYEADFVSSLGFWNYDVGDYGWSHGDDVKIIIHDNHGTGEKIITIDMDGPSPQNCGLIILASDNNPPDPPTNPIPDDNWAGIEINPILNVNISDPDDDSMDVTFYNASDDSVIGTDYNVASGGTAATTWLGLSYSTNYNWYTIADDGTNTTQSSTWSFTTKERRNGTPNPPNKPSGPVESYSNTSCIYETFTSDPDEDQLWYQWDWEDEISEWIGPYNSGKTISVEHKWENIGYYDVRVRAKDDEEHISSWSPILTVLIIDINATPPVADFTLELIDCGSIQFANKATDPDGFIMSVLWDFGDGKKSSEMNPTHTYKKSDDYTVTLTVLDNDNLTSTVTKSLYVPKKPRAEFSIERTNKKTVEFYDKSNDSDNVIQTWYWDFGDGSTSHLKNPSHVYDQYGDYDVSLTVETNYGCYNKVQHKVSLKEPKIKITYPKLGWFCLHRLPIFKIKYGSIILNWGVAVDPGFHIETNATSIDKVLFRIENYFGRSYQEYDDSPPFEHTFDNAMIGLGYKVTVKGYINDNLVASHIIHPVTYIDW